jgi:hypothetical protein
MFTTRPWDKQNKVPFFIELASKLEPAQIKIGNNLFTSWISLYIQLMQGVPSEIDHNLTASH